MRLASVGRSGGGGAGSSRRRREAIWRWGREHGYLGHRNADLSCAGVCVACGQAVRMSRVRLAWRALLVSAVRKRGQAGTVVCFGEYC